ncbi:MAG: YceI family protein [Cyclobacteriaceae bacterium]
MEAVKTIWDVDTAHSEVTFKVRHLVIASVTGYFKKFNASIETDGDDLENAKINFEADINSITTNNEDRDNHLKSDDFFNAAQYPKLIFVGKSLQKTGEGEYKLTGDLTIRNVTKEINLDVEGGQTAVDPYGNTKIGFEISGKINRKEYGLKWDAVTEAGNTVVSDQVKIGINIQFIKA